MPDPLTMLAIVALTVTSLTVLLAKLIPDEYDSFKPEPIRLENAENV